ncbi:AC transposable element-derived protein 4 [Colletotrichum tofieldiae]|uniref:AC transposable element-derived protein 4 n=1 Tax=Colletotrichum tofieldiae TaxID=708197 RepID=A0A166QEZ3_9PEZI|nr:AC transposable element-derived protein 4 [Colletotrichum tofieldiae]
MSSSDSDASGASGASVRSCIVVELLPEDLAVACTADCTPERCDNSTVRPHEPPAVERGRPGTFRPFDVPARDRGIRDLPAAPLDLFLQYVPRDLVEQWAQWTNTAPLSKEGPRAKRSRVYEWRKTSVEEIYLFLGILLYMGIHNESQISRYWSTQQQKEDPIHLFTRFTSRDRFQSLLRQLRIFNTSDFQPSQSGQRQAQAGMPDIYRKVNDWSAHIQETGDSFYVAGSDLTVDEAMVRFTGRSLETTTIPTKPTPTGFKVWILAQSGYCLRWLWHVHGKGPYGLVPQARPADSQAGVATTVPLTPTQRVVTTLVTLLPVAVYHVFLDNLFASIRLLRALRKQQVGASGTCRKDSGIDKILVTEKEAEGQGISWGQTHCIPALDGEVNQFTWKDNALVLFMTTVFRDGQEVTRLRRRPAGNSASKRAAWQVFGPDVRKNLPVPKAIDEYNHKMNGVDISDQMRTYYQYSHPIRRGGWQALAWNFLLEVIIVNSFFLQFWGKPEWQKVKTSTNGGNCLHPSLF